MLIETFLLLFVFQIKHLIADYYLQFPYMYENKGKDKDWFKPLLDHSLVHAGMTLLILALFGNMVAPEANTHTIALILGLGTTFDFVTHFATDRWKATRGRAPNESKFWTDLGIDQMIHHIVGIIIVWFTVLQISIT